MSTQKDKSKEQSAEWSALAGHKCVVGARQIRKALNTGAAHRVFLARNADPAITVPLAALCQHHQVEFAWVKSMIDLGHACGIEVGATAAAIVE